MNIAPRHVLWTAVAIVLLGLAVAWSGVISVGASSGHWAVTDWFLHWAMRNSARTQAALFVDEPASDAAGLVSAAGHFAVNCAPCHGAPGERRSTVMQAATPPPPELADNIDTYRDRELFWIIKHGVKFTAMPAWPAQDRDDEVRRMAAFVRRLPRMGAAEYRALAYGPGRLAGGASQDLEAAFAECERCHADDGRGQPDIPVLAGQKSDYLLSALEAFATGKRASAVMTAAATRVDPRILRDLADRYSAMPGLDSLRDVTITVAQEDTDVARIVSDGLPERDLPACAECHSQGSRPDYPVLAGQKAEYLAARLRLWRTEEQPIEARRSRLTMPTIARRIPESMIDPLARHFAQDGP
jgi:cytochrome c553